MKKLLLVTFLFSFQFFMAQVGINTTSPNAQLDIQSTNQAAPTSTDGLLIPKMDVFPVINPTAAQQGMLVYLTTATTFSGNPKPIGFYYWNDSPADWIAVKGTDGGTLDQAYDFGGAGLGKRITADSGAVLIDGTDGLVSTGTVGGAIAPSGGGKRMVWNPRKAAFRVGQAFATEWDDSNIGIGSVAFGIATISSANQTSAFGFGTTASGNVASAFGSSTIASGSVATSFGSSTIASGNIATAFGQGNTAPSFGETVLGIGAATYTPSTNGDTQFRTANATDRLFVVGNAIDANNNNIVDLSERSDALVVVKNGLTRLPSTTNTMIDAADGKAVVTKEWLQQNTSGTLDQAYDFGGAGSGKTITADAGAVLINGTDGLVSTGTSSTGAVAPSGIGTRMVWNPRKVAFRAGFVSGSQWDDVNIGPFSSAFGQNCIASGPQSFATGFANTASGTSSAAFGHFNIASGGLSATFGLNTTASGDFSTAFGRVSSANGENSFVQGINNSATSFGETVLGIGATLYSTSLNGATQFRAANSNDRLFVVGNAIDSNNSGFVDAIERSDALVILKNGITRLPATTNAMITAADGKAVVTKEYLSANTSGTLDQAYDFGGAGNGRVITADTGAVLIDGTDGLVSTGTAGTGAVAPSGAGTRMVWNPRKAAFRAGNVSGTQWDDVNVGVNSIAMGAGAVASGLSSIALGSSSVALGMGSVAFGWFARANATQSTAFGLATIASNIYSTAFGYEAIASGRASISFGVTNEAESFGETVLGIGATSYTPSLNGANQFRAANATDRLLVVGNAIDNDNDDAVDNAERSNALVILKNGNTGIGASLPVEKLQVAGRTLLTNGFSADNAALLYQNNTDYMFLGPQSGSSANGAALALFGTTNTSGGNAGGVDFNVPNGQVRMNHTNGNFNFSANSTSGYNANFEINDVGLQIGHNSASRAVVFRTASTERMRLTAAGDFGIGTTTPAEKLHVSGPAGLTAVRIGNTSAIGATSNVALDFFRNTGVNTDWRIYNIGANLTIGNSADDLATVNDLYQFQGARFMPMNDGTQNLGQGANRWNTLFATNGTINTSDRREKKEIQPLQYGLNQLMQLKPVTFKWNNPQIDNGNKHLGFIAQDLQEVIPEVVVDSEWIEVEGQGKVWKKTPLLGVNYAEVIPVLVRSIQEQQTIIEAQKKEIEEQKKLLESVMQRLTKMEQR